MKSCNKFLLAVASLSICVLTTGAFAQSIVEASPAQNIEEESVGQTLNAGIERGAAENLKSGGFVKAGIAVSTQS